MELKKYKLGEICDLNLSSLKASDSIDDILYLDTSSITEDTISGLQSFSTIDAPSRAQRKVKNDTIIFSTVRPNQRHFGIMRNPQKNLIVSSGFTTLDVKNPKEYDPKFVYFALTQPAIVDYLQTLAHNSVSAYPSINPDDIGNLYLSFPDFDTQRKIASVLSALDSKIALNRRINTRLEQIAKRLYDYWFVQFDFPNADGKPYKSNGGKMVWNEQLKREIPEGREDGVLQDIANITMGQSPDGSSYNEIGEGIVFYQGCTDFGIRFPSVRMFTTSPTRFAKEGDILMSVRAPVGAMNVANSNCCIGRGLAALNSKIGSISHLWYLMDVFKHKFENKNAAGTTFGSITKDELYNLPVVIPTIELIAAFNEKTQPIFNYQLTLSKETAALTALRDRLLPLLMNGQVEVA